MTPPPKFKPFVPEGMQMREFTWRAVLLGLVMCVVLGAANAYLGLKAGQTIAATYPAAVIGMAMLRVFKGSILEENIARTAGSIGESVAAGAVFTLPAFVHGQACGIVRFRRSLLEIHRADVVGSVLGVLFVSLIRRVMVEDPELPFPESVAASEMHKAGSRVPPSRPSTSSTTSASALSRSWQGLSAASRLTRTFSFASGNWAKARCASARSVRTPHGGHRRRHHRCRAQCQPGLHRGRLHHRAGTGGAQFLRRRDRLGPADSAASSISSDRNSGDLPAGATKRTGLGLAAAVWRFIVRPIAVGGMMVGACYTLFRMRKSLVVGPERAVADLKKCGRGRSRRPPDAPNAT